MAYLLDTHTFLWFVEGSERLPESVRKIIADVKQPFFLSVGSLWEITIKFQLGKLELGLSLDELYRFAERNQIEVIPINQEHLTTLLSLDFVNRDPFDRIIVSQAISENLILITCDKVLKGYPIEELWE